MTKHEEYRGRINNDPADGLSVGQSAGGRIQGKLVSLANWIDLVGIIQNRPDGSLLVIAEGEKKDKLERLALSICSQERPHPGG